VKFRFDADQAYQLEAIGAVADLFDGQVRIEQPEFTLHSEHEVAAVANRLDLGEAELFANLQVVQAHNRITPDPGLRYLEGNVVVGPTRRVRFPNFSVEMETGTGKTYVYLRTLLELHRRYGLRKFVIVVPSVAVREGVLKDLTITEEHFRGLFDNPVCRYYRYDSGNLALVRQFALSESIEVMIMTIDSFNKAANVMVRVMDQMQGQTPIHLVQATRPVLILDEPQNLESDKAKAALANLNPLFALRYSATHRDPYNLVYRLTPYQAYQQGLVKRIQVASVVKVDDANRPYLRLDDIRVQRTKVTARIAVHALMARGTVKEKTVTVVPGDSLATKAKRTEYADYTVDTIDPHAGLVRFAPANVDLKVGESIGADKEAIFRAQIEYTIRKHLETQRRVRDRGVKVLSLFFIDRVDNYAQKDGVIRRLFVEAFNRLKGETPEWRDLGADDVQAAYFASRRRKTGEVELLESATGESREDEVAYDLIMRDKETLLSFPDRVDDDETAQKKRVCFIFSHSALREGWDNPNVFQICTLNQAVSNVRKRQEVGRGVRLARDQAGERVFEQSVNVLTVVANESYEKYIRTLQSEIAEEYRLEIEKRYGKSIESLSEADRLRIAEEYGADILPPPPAPADRPKARLRKERVATPEFKELWERIKHRTRYSVTVDTGKLLADVIPAINRLTVSPPRVTVTEALVVSEREGFAAAQTTAQRTVEILSSDAGRPNLVALMGELMERTTPRVYLTRTTLLEVLKRTANKQAMLDNPHEFARLAVGVLKEKVLEQLVDGIRYEKIGTWWEMQQIVDEDVLDLFSRFTEPADRALYDHVPCDSRVERDFVRALEARKDVRLYMKLPPWFEVPTPLGKYRPDWAIVVEDAKAGEALLYLVAETKGSIDVTQLRTSEARKIWCGARHFGSKQLKVDGALEGVEYKVVSSASQL
jgi:type III restriction enzyme